MHAVPVAWEISEKAETAGKPTLGTAANKYLGMVIWRTFLATLSLATSSFAEASAYANSSFELPAGARLPGMGNVSLGMPGDGSFLLANPAALAELDRPEGFFHHANLYQGLDIAQDEIFGVMPLGKATVLGFGGQRLSATGILRVEEGQTPDFSNPNTFDAADWTAAAAVARSLYDGHLLVGGLMRLSVRDLDQWGLGAQLDGSVVWKPNEHWRLGARLERAIATATVWESGTREWSPMDVSIGTGYEAHVPYLYGRGSIGLETPGLFETQASNTFSTEPARLWDDPSLFLRSCRFGGEFRFDWGGVIRAGAEIQAITRWSDIFQGKDESGLYGESWGQMGFGVGYVWNERLRIDYGLQSHPDLGPSHRIALGWLFGEAPAKRKPASEDGSEEAPVPRHELDPVPAGEEAHPEQEAPEVGAPAPQQAPVPPAAPASVVEPVAPAPVAAPVVEPSMPVAPAVLPKAAPESAPPAPAADDEPVEQLQK
ncbi:MAG: hypothetical protein RL318_617 [Fibrobacterota bacterium]|jgi:hypothetical protein